MKASGRARATLAGWWQGSRREVSRSCCERSRRPGAGAAPRASRRPSARDDRVPEVAHPASRRVDARSSSARGCLPRPDRVGGACAVKGVPARQVLDRRRHEGGDPRSRRPTSHPHRLHGSPRVRPGPRLAVVRHRVCPSARRGGGDRVAHERRGHRGEGHGARRGGGVDGGAARACHLSERLPSWLDG